MDAFIIDLKENKLIVERSYGQPWSYSLNRKDMNQEELNELTKRKKAGWEELCIATFERVKPNEKLMRLTDLRF